VKLRRRVDSFARQGHEVFIEIYLGQCNTTMIPVHCFEVTACLVTI
jgi:hypothetical protein